MRDMLCYCLNLSYEDVGQLWRAGYFQRSSDRQPGAYCTGCRGDLGCFLSSLAAEAGERSEGVRGDGERREERPCGREDREPRE
jgi:hypothetical protein